MIKVAFVHSFELVYPQYSAISAIGFGAAQNLNCERRLGSRCGLCMSPAARSLQLQSGRRKITACRLSEQITRMLRPPAQGDR